MANEITYITDFELKEDLIESMKGNPDIKISSEEVEAQIKNTAFGTLLEVEKKIGSNITILSIKEVNEQLLASAFS